MRRNTETGIRVETPRRMEYRAVQILRAHGAANVKVYDTAVEAKMPDRSSAERAAKAMPGFRVYPAELRAKRRRRNAKFSTPHDARARKLLETEASLEYRMKDAKEAMEAAISMGDMDGVEKYARQHKRFQRDYYDIQQALSRVGGRPSAWGSGRATKSRREAYKTAGKRAAKVISRKRNNSDRRGYIARLRKGMRIQLSLNGGKTWGYAEPIVKLDKGVNVKGVPYAMVSTAHTESRDGMAYRTPAGKFVPPEKGGRVWGWTSFSIGEGDYGKRWRIAGHMSRKRMSAVGAYRRNGLDWKVTWKGQHKWFPSQAKAVAWALEDRRQWIAAGGGAPDFKIIYQPSGKIVKTIRGV